MMYGWHDGGWGVGAWVAMIAVMVVFWAAVVGVVMLALRHRHDPSHQGPSPSPPVQAGPEGAGTDPAMRVLEERFARGELDAEEFTHRRDLLRSR